MASMTMQNVVYSPGTMVDGGKVRFDWDTVLDCSPNPLPGSFSWTIKFLTADGTYWQNGGAPVSITNPSEPVLGTNTHVGLWWTPPASLPQGGVRPEWTQSSACGDTTMATCTGITRIPGDGLGASHDGDKVISCGCNCPLN